jgi:hypothetical protein
VPAAAIADARSSLGGWPGLDQGVVLESGRINAAPTDVHGLVAARAPGQVLNAVYQSPRSVTAGGFFPWGVNGELTRSDASA